MISINKELQLFAKNIGLTSKKTSTSIQKTINKKYSKPKQISLLTVHECLFKCKHCFLWQRHGSNNPIELKHWFKFLEEIKEIYGNEAQIEIGGDGMALLDDKLIPLIKYSTKLGLYTTLTSNGFLINKKILRKLEDSGLKSLVISLDFLTPKKHDSQRGVKNSFKHVMELIKNIDSSKIKPMISCIIMKPNLNEVIPIVNYIDNEDKLNGIFFHVITAPLGLHFEKPWYTTDKFSYLWPGNEVINIINELKDKKKLGSKIFNTYKHLDYFKFYFRHPDTFVEKNNCDAKNLGFELSVDGNVTICPRKSNLGSLKHNSFSNLLKNNYQDLSNEISECALNCQQIMNSRFEKQA